MARWLLHEHLIYNHGSHRDWKTENLEKWENISSQGKVREFCQDRKSQGNLSVQKSGNHCRISTHKMQEGYRMLCRCQKITGILGVQLAS